MLRLAAAGLFVWSLGAQASTDTYRTELFLESQSVDGITTVVFEWSTAETSGIINARGLIDYSISLFAGSALIYTNDILIDGAIQPLSSVARDDPFWEFDLDTLTLRQFNLGAIRILRSGAVSGTHFAVADGISLPVDSTVLLWKFENGIQTFFEFATASNQRTTNVNVPGVVHQVHVGGPDVCSGLDRKPGCDGNFSLTANQFSDGEVNGRWTDRFGNGTGMTAAIDCLYVSGNEAWVSGHVVATNSPFFSVGQAVTTRVRDNGVSNRDLPDETSFTIRFDAPCTDARMDYPLFPYVEGQVTVR